MNPLESSLIAWNNKFPKDRLYRKKYNIAFGSNEHRNTNQIDIYFDSLEDKLFLKYSKLYLENKERQDEYKSTGKWLKDIEMDEKKMEDLFDKLDVKKLNVDKDV